MSHHDFVVGTFGTQYLFSIRFTPSRPSSPASSSLKVLKRHDGIGSHSWLHLSPTTPSGRRNLYATAWTKDSLVAAYEVHSSTDIRLLNTASTKSRSGYVCASSTHVYSAGGATGEVFTLDPETGSYCSPDQLLRAATNGELQQQQTQPEATNSSHNQQNSVVSHAAQNLDFVAKSGGGQRDDGSTMDFGGLRHGAHSADLSPDGRLLYIADIGRNCIWTFSVNSDVRATQHLVLAEKKISPRRTDGPRHVWPHPNGKYVYCLQEHTSVVDVFEVAQSCDGKVKLVHVQGVRIIPRDLPVGDFWADEVRTSLSNGSMPRYLYASTRGLREGQKGYVTVFALTADGLIDGAEILESETSEDEDASADDQGGLLCMYETATSGGWANAIQPGPTVNGMEYIAMTDSEVGFVFVLSWDGKEIQEAARVDLNEGGKDGEHGAATAVWF